MNKNIIYIIIFILVISVLFFSKEAFTYCFDNDDYKYRIEPQNPCNIHEIDMKELKPIDNNIGDKICMNDNYQFRKKEDCDAAEFEVYKKENFSNIVYDDTDDNDTDNNDDNDNDDNINNTHHEKINIKCRNPSKQVRFKLHPLVHLD